MATKTRGWGIARGAKKVKRFAEGGDAPEGGRFAESDPDIYTRARKWVESQTNEDKAEPVKAAGKPAVKVSSTATRTQSAKATDIASDDSSTRTAPKMVGTGSGRGGQGGPTADELSKYNKRQKALELTDTTPRPGDPEFMPIPGAGGAARAALQRTGALVTRGFDKITPIANRARPAVQEAIEGPARTSARLEGPAGTTGIGGPTTAPRVGGSGNTARLEAPRASAAERRAAEGFSPEEALAKLKETAKPAAKKAPAKKTVKGPSKPTESRKTRKFNDDEAGTEFAKGGKVKSVRGWGKARNGKSFKVY